ncbi:MAG: type II secretion system F family protein [Acidimicrobiales bacterium]
MIGVAAAAMAAYGTFLVFTAVALDWRGVGFGPARPSGRRPGVRAWLALTGVAGSAPGRLLAPVLAVVAASAGLGYVVFGGALPAAVIAVFAGSFPIAAARSRHRRRMEAAGEAWPRMLEELRLLTGSAGRSIPQALFEVGRRAPVELRPAFEVAEREWLLTTDFERTLAVLKERMVDPTADVVAETLLVAHDVGGGSLDRQLADLVEDRLLDQQGRKDAVSKQAGVRFARSFVLLVPLGMALAGLSIGTGRTAYASAPGQIAVVVAVLAVVACWAWSGRLMRLPEEPRVLARPTGGARR